MFGRVVRGHWGIENRIAPGSRCRVPRRPDPATQRQRTREQGDRPPCRAEPAVWRQTRHQLQEPPRESEVEGRLPGNSSPPHCLTVQAIRLNARPLVIASYFVPMILMTRRAAGADGRIVLRTLDNINLDLYPHNPLIRRVEVGFDLLGGGHAFRSYGRGMEGCWNRCCRRSGSP